MSREGATGPLPAKALHNVNMTLNIIAKPKTIGAVYPHSILNNGSQFPGTIRSLPRRLIANATLPAKLFTAYLFKYRSSDNRLLAAPISDLWKQRTLS
jgi:hypothetical protein